MRNELNIQVLAEIGAQVVVLSTGRYALPACFRLRDQAVECLVPTWSGIGDIPEELQMVALVGVGSATTRPRWLFIAGSATVVANPDFDGFSAIHTGKVPPSDLYQVLRIQPKRIEYIDEQKGWGHRETVDL